jgi:hypothetical protein
MAADKYKALITRNHLHPWYNGAPMNTLDAMNNLKCKQIDSTQAFSQANLKKDIYLRFPAGFEHKNEKWALKLKRNL